MQEFKVVMTATIARTLTVEEENFELALAKAAKACDAMIRPIGRKRIIARIASAGTAYEYVLNDSGKPLSRRRI